MASRSPDRHSGNVKSAPQTEGRRRRVPIAAVLAVVAGAAIVAIWIWAFAAGTSDPLGKLDDQSYGATASAICEAATAQVEALPPAFEATTAAERAETVERSNDIYIAMLDKLAAAAPTSGRDSGMIHEWIGDWRTYVSDRADYADRLRIDESSRFYVSTREGSQLTTPIDRFARINGMLPCSTPSDLS